MTPEEIQSALKHHRDILLATIDYINERTAGRMIFDQFDPGGHHLQQLKQKTERHYLAGRLSRLQKMLRDLTEMPRKTRDVSFVGYLQKKTGYDTDILKSLLIDFDESINGTKTPKSRRKSSPKNNHYHNQLSESRSPDNKRTIIITESGIDRDSATTYVFVQFERSGGGGIYGVNGINLGIKASWKDNNTIVIETKKEYFVNTKCGQVQCLDHIVKIEHIEK